MNKPVQISEWFIESAWPYMQRGDKAGYFAEIARCVEENLKHEPVDVVVLAQASMAGAEPLCDHLAVPVFSSPRLGLEEALKRSTQLVHPPPTPPAMREGRKTSPVIQLNFCA